MQVCSSFFHSFLVRNFAPTPVCPSSIYRNWKLLELVDAEFIDGVLKLGEKPESSLRGRIDQAERIFRRLASSNTYVAWAVLYASLASDARDPSGWLAGRFYEELKAEKIINKKERKLRINRRVFDTWIIVLCESGPAFREYDAKDPAVRPIDWRKAVLERWI